MRLIIMILILGVNASHATEAEENYKLAATRLTIAYQCAPILDDNSFYELAKRNSVELIGDEKSEKLFSLVEAQDRENNPITVALCQSLLKDLVTATKENGAQ